MAFLNRYKKIKYKIILIVLITSVITISIGQLIGLYYNISNSEDRLTERTKIYARLIGEYCVAPLTFNDISGVDDILVKLQSQPEIEHLLIFNDQNELVTSYNQVGISDTSIIKNLVVDFEFSGFINNEYHTSLPIVYAGFKYGTIYVIASTHSVAKNLKDNLIQLLILFIVLGVLSYILAGQFQIVISRPIVQLASNVQEIAKAGDYSVRVEKNTNDEIGVLYDNFNNMLNQIQSREKAKAKAEEILKIERDKIKNYLDIAGVIIMALDTEANIIQLNRKGCELLQVSEQDVVGKNWYDLFVKEERKQQGKQAFNDIIESGEINYEQVEAITVTANGDERLISWNDVFLHDNDGNIIGIISSGEDITEKKQKDLIIQSTNEKLVSLIDNSPLGIFHFDNLGNTTLVNKAICSLLKVTSEQLLGYNILKNSKNEPIINALQKCLNGEHSVFEGEFLNVFNKEKIFARAVFTPLLSEKNKNTGGFCMIEDISERLRIDKMQLDRDAAEASNRAKSEFLARMSHEIRTPMNAIIGLSHLCMKTKLNNQQIDYVLKINNSGKHLLGIINDILDYSKIEAGKLTIENTKFNLEKSFSDLSNMISLKAQKKGLEVMFLIDPNVPNQLIGDPLRLGQVMINLANNAVKFTEKGDIILRVSIVKRSSINVELKFVIEDTGIGMTKKQIDNLFQPFSQADVSTSRKYGGTGLGLVIAKRLVSLMGGKIWVESEREKGSKFIFTAKFGIDSTSDDIPKGILDGIRVLVCDDNQTSLQFLCKVMELYYLDVVGVESGFEAIKVLEENNETPFNLVIMDWMMPGMDGLTTIEKIKNSSKIKQMPAFIMLTAYGKDRSMQKRVKELELEGFVEKPITRSTLLDTIMTSIGKNEFFKRTVLSEVVVPKEMDYIIGSKILLAEDNEINAQVASELLESEGFEVEVAVNGEEALNMVKNSGDPSKYDIVLMDIQMPEMDGYTATIEIRKMLRYHNLPIVAMTADAMVGVEDKCLEIGMQDFVTKPINPEILFNCLVKWIIPSDESKSKEKNKELLQTKQSYTKESLPNLQTIVTSEGLKRIGGNTSSYISLLSKFYDNNQQFINTATEHYNNGETNQLLRMLHTLKGVSGNIGAKSLHEVVIEVENEIRNNKNTEIEILFNQISEKLNPVLQEIKNSIIDKASEKQSSKTEVLFDKGKVMSMLNKIVPLLEENDAQAIEIANELTTTAGYIEHLDEIQEALKSYDFDTALVLVKKINEILENE